MKPSETARDDNLAVLDDAAGYRSIFENATLGIYRSTPDGRLVRANPALVRLNGYTSETEMLAALAIGGNEWYVDPTRRAEFYRRVAAEGGVKDFVSEVRRMKTGERIWVSENAWPVYGSDGTIRFYEGTVEDITVRRALEEQLLAAKLAAEAGSEAKSTFLAMMSHELRSPLTTVIGFAEIIAGQQLGPNSPRYAEYAEDIRASGSQLLDLLQDILDLSKIGAGRMVLNESRLALADLGRRTVRIFAAQAYKAGIALESRVPEDLPVVLGDPLRLGQILSNLVANALKFTPAGGEVEIGAGLVPDGAALWVADSGIGMSEEEAARALEPFVQIEDPLQASGGAGLGLSICRELAALHGGRLEIESAKGAGTKVTLILPKERLEMTAP